MPLSIPEQFLKRILPSQGWLCGLLLPERKHVWAKTAEELASKLLQLDEQRRDVPGHATYHACASFLQKGIRKQNNVQSVRSLWLDIDSGPDKPYADFATAFDEFEKFRKDTGLPIPIYVGSGYGLHVYWPLQEELSGETWAGYAQGLKQLCVERSLSADPSRTCDPSSVLRPVGTHNWKDIAHPKLVEWGGDVDPYPLWMFPSLSGISVPRAKPATMSKAMAELANVYQNTPSDPHQIAGQCAQMKNFRDRKGAMPEPEWKAGIGVLAFCEGGEQIAHEWSMGDARYSAFETTKKFEASKSMSGPTSCAHFFGLNTACAGCPFKGTITTPVELGRGLPRLTPAQVVFAETVAQTDPVLPSIGAFTHSSGSLVFASEKDGRESNIRITQYPVIIESISRGELNSESHSIVLKHKSPHEGWQSIIVPLKVLFGASGIAEIMGKGIVVHNADLFRQYVRESMDQLNAVKRAQTQFDQFGWKEDETTFLIGSRLYTATGMTENPGGEEVRRRSKGMGPQKKGSLVAWKENVDMLFASGFEAQGFAVLASFSAPFMRWQAHSEGGSILSLVSRLGGKGKSTALTAAASVWGRLEAMKQINSDTRVARGIVMGVMGNLPVIRDEYTQRDPEILREEVQIFTEGRDKQRGAADGTLISMGASWQTLMIAGSNTSLVDTLRAAKNGEAMSGRVVEFVIDIPKNTAHWKGDQLKDTIDDNAGYAGEAFIQAVLQPGNLPYLKSLVPKVREDIIRRHALTSDKRFIARTLAGVAVAGHVVRHLGLLDISVDRVMEWAQDTLFSDNIQHSRKIEEPSYMLARFLAEHIQNTLVMPGPFKSRTIQPVVRFPSKGLMIRQEIASRRIFIEIKALRTWMQKEEQPWKDLVDDLVNRGVMLNPHRLITLAAGTDMSTGQIPCVELKSDHPVLTGLLAEVEKEKVA